MDGASAGGDAARVLVRAPGVVAQGGYEAARHRDADTVITAISFIKPMALDLAPRRGGKKEQMDLGIFA
jgi:hypothetical protein